MRQTGQQATEACNSLRKWRCAGLPQPPLLHLQLASCPIIRKPGAPVVQVYSQRHHDAVRDLLALGRPQIGKPAAPLKYLHWFPAADAEELQVVLGWGGCGSLLGYC